MLYRKYDSSSNYLMFTYKASYLKQKKNEIEILQIPFYYRKILFQLFIFVEMKPLHTFIFSYKY